jgi:hypothetical protein
MRGESVFKVLATIPSQKNISVDLVDMRQAEAKLIDNRCSPFPEHADPLSIIAEA